MEELGGECFARNNLKRTVWIVDGVCIIKAFVIRISIIPLQWHYSQQFLFFGVLCYNGIKLLSYTLLWYENYYINILLIL